MKLLAQVAILCLCVSCFIRCTKNNTSENSALPTTDFTCNAGELHFDKVEAYTISYEDLLIIQNRRPQSDNDKLLDRIVNYFPVDNLKETDSAKLVAIGFTSKNLNKEDYQYLCDLFKERFVYEDTTACAPIFRDILLFKEKQKLIGLAKVCYSCGHSVVDFGDSLGNVNVYKLDALLNLVSQTVR